MSGLFKNPVFQLIVVAVASWFNPVLGSAVAMGFGIYNAKVAQQRARDAYNASLKDRIISVRTTEAPVTIAYGECVVAGPWVYANTSGANQDLLTIGLALGPGHQITGVDDVYLNNLPMGPLSGGLPTNAPWVYQASNNLIPTQESFTCNGSVQNFTLSKAAYNNQGAAYILDNRADQSITVSIAVTFTGTNAQINTAGYSGLTVTIFYNYSELVAGWAWASYEVHVGSNPENSGTYIPYQDANWTTAHRGDERPWLALYMVYSEDLFPTGIPSIKAKIRGKALYDPRTGTTYYNKNVALAIRDYLTSPLGFGATAAEIDDTTVIAAANICDEVITTRTYNTGTGQWQTTTGPRYTCNGILSTEAFPADNLQMLCEAMGGFAVYSQGKWRIFAGAYRAPIMTLSEADLVGGAPITIKHYTERKDIFNAVKGQFIDPVQNYQPVNYPAYKASSYITEDGETIYADFDFPLTNSSQDAQRLAKLKLGLARLSLFVEARWSFKTYKLQVGDSITLNLSRYGISSRVMRVVRRTFSLTEGITLSLAEDSSSAYSWVYDEAIAPPVSQKTNLPDPRTVQVPTNIIVTSGNATLLKTADGTIVARLKVTWAAMTSQTILEGGAIEVRVVCAADADWTYIVKVPGDSTEVYIPNVKEGFHYLVYVRSINGAGNTSVWVQATTHQATGKSSAPPALTNMTVSVLADGTRKFTITAPSVADGAFIIVRYVAGNSSNWGAMTQLFAMPYDDYTTTFIYETNLPVKGTWSFGAKLVDSSGNESVNALYITNATLAYSPITYGVVSNLLTNANWELDLGWGTSYYPDTRALYGWDWGGYSGTFGRNYDNGKVYNIGKGGCSIYRPTPTVDGQYTYLWQNVRIEVGLEYEASVYVQVHRCQAILYLRFLNQAQDTVLLDVTESIDAGTGILGNAYNPFDPPRLWVKGTAPAGAYYAQIILLAASTANTVNTAPYYAWTAWNYVLLCRAPSGVTKETATPWVEGTIPTLPGGIIVGGTITDVVTQQPADSSLTDYVYYGIDGPVANFATVSWSNNTPNSVPIQIGYQMQGYGTPGVGGGGMYVSVYLDGNLQPNGPRTDYYPPNEWTPFGGVHMITVPAGSTVSATLGIAALWMNPVVSRGGEAWTVYWKNASINLQGIRK